MATINTVLERLKGFSLMDAAMDAAMEHKEDFLKTHKAQLYERGERKDGRKLRRYANPFYADMKHEMNPQVGLGNPDLFLTGAFMNSRFIRKTGEDVFEFGATDEKTEMLEVKYGLGSTVLGLSDESKQKACDDFYRDAVLEKVHERTKL